MGFDWKKWILLSDEQYAAIDRALLRAEGCSEIEEAIVHDLALLRQGIGKIGTCELTLKELYGEALYRLHPLLVLIRQLKWLADQYAAHGIPDQILLIR